MNSDLIQRMDEAQRSIRFACDENLYKLTEGASFFILGIREYIGEWQSEIIRMERELKTERERLQQQGAELEARASILNRLVKHKLALFPDELGNGWIDSVERMALEIKTLRGELSFEVKQREMRHEAWLEELEKRQALELELERAQS